PGFRLHLDAAAMTFSEESPESSLPRAKNVLCHFHISEKNLAAVGSGTVKHEIFAHSIQQIGFNGFRSLEMVLPSGADTLSQIQASLEFAIRLYFPETGEL